jgi:thermitase
MQNKITLFIQTIKGFPKRKKILLLSGCVLFLLLLILIPVLVFTLSGETKTKIDDTKITAPHVTDQLIIKYKKDITPTVIFEEKIRALGGVSQKKVYSSNDATLSRYYLINFQKGTNLEVVRQKLKEFEELDAADPNYIDTIQDVANDPYIGEEWGLQKMDMTNAWTLGKGSTSVKVAVIDTGIDGNHPDLQGKVTEFVNCLSGSCTNSSAVDDFGHGTHVAGTIGATTNNNLGVAGINWEVSLMGIKALDSNGSGSTNIINQGIVYAADHGANVINMSLGGSHPCTASDQDAVNYALGKNVVIVVAAGNSSADAANFSPASCQGTITVGASSSTDTRASFSNFGSKVDISAPGVNILSLKSRDCRMVSTRTGQDACVARAYQNTYLYLDGTSMASPHVAGVAALLLAVNQGLAPSQVKSCLVNNADPISTDMPIGPRLNAFKTLNACSGLAPITGAPTPTTNPNIPTATPTIPPVTDKPFIGGITFTDTNGNQKMDTGEPALSGVKITLTQTNGTYKNTIYSGSNGSYYFSKINPGNYTLLAEYGTARVTGDFPGMTSSIGFNDADLPFPAATVIPTSTPTPGVIAPTSTPIPPVQNTTPTPIPTIYQMANCVFDPASCKSGTGAIQQCTLKCTAK